MANKLEKFSRDVAAILYNGYLYNGRISIEDIHKAELFLDSGMHRQRRLGIYSWIYTNNKESYGTSIDFTFEFLLEKELIENCSFETCNRIVFEVKYNFIEFCHKPEKRYTQEQLDIINQEYLSEDEDEDT